VRKTGGLYEVACSSVDLHKIKVLRFGVRRKHNLPFEWGGVLVVSGNEVVNGLAHLPGRNEADAAQRLPAKNGESTRLCVAKNIKVANGQHIQAATLQP
jgi:hypothetical protein